MRRGVWCALVAGVAPAWADGLEVHRRAEETPAGGWLELDPVLVTRLQGLGTREQAERTDVTLGTRVRLTVEGRRWREDDRGERTHLDLRTRGWRARVGVAIDLGFATLSASRTIGHVDQRVGAGTYVDTGIELRRTFLRRGGHTLWIGVSLGQRQWRGDPPGAEENATELILSVGGTFD